jgi:S-adenosyl methyltransferase
MPDIHKTSPDTGTPLVRRFDTAKPSPARIYDYFLDGKDNYEVDRAAAAEVEERLPQVRKMMKQNRAFMTRAVHYLAAECGVRQFIDIGSGLPTPHGNVHGIAQAVAPDARVVYVDNDPVVLSHGRALLASDHTAVVTADLRDPDAILSHLGLCNLIDLREPVALLLVAVLHFIPDEDRPADIVRTLRAATVPGSYLTLSHADRTPQVESAAQVYDRATSQGFPRSRSEVESYFGKFELVPPGLVQVSQWRPDSGSQRQQDVPWWGGVARHPGEGVTDV